MDANNDSCKCHFLNWFTAVGFWQAVLMPRQMRREFAGAIYHGMNRGDRREEIFRQEADYRMFLSTRKFKK